MELVKKPEYEPGRSPLIKNLMPGLTEVGKIKIGKKGELRTGTNGTWQMPVKLDHFIITTLERDKDNNFVVDASLMKTLGEKPRRIPICLLFDSIEANFQSRYSCYNGKTLFCSGDGVAAYRQVEAGKEKQLVDCPCGKEQPGYKGKDKCKINGCLSCMVDGANTIGGIWKFRTTGYNSTVGIMSSLSLIRAMSGGLLAGLPLDMTIQPKVGTDPDGKSVTIQVVGVVFRGSISDLQKQTLQIATSNADFRMRLANVEQEVKQLTGIDVDAIDQAADITDEFYPEGDTEKTEGAALAEPTQPAMPAPEQPAPAAQTPATPPAATRTRKRTSETQAAPAPVPVPEPPAQPAPTPEPEQPVVPVIAAPEGINTDLFDMGE
jgi:hypothetical protein